MVPLLSVPYAESESRRSSSETADVDLKPPLLDTMLETNCPDLKLIARGKVRDIYEIPGSDDSLLFVATDRISAYDVILDSVRFYSLATVGSAGYNRCL